MFEALNPVSLWSEHSQNLQTYLQLTGWWLQSFCRFLTWLHGVGRRYREANWKGSPKTPAPFPQTHACSVLRVGRVRSERTSGKEERSPFHSRLASLSFVSGTVTVVWIGSFLSHVWHITGLISSRYSYLAL